MGYSVQKEGTAVFVLCLVVLFFGGESDDKEPMKLDRLRRIGPNVCYPHPFGLECMVANQKSC
jgi:hypothetical protein